MLSRALLAATLLAACRPPAGTSHACGASPWMPGSAGRAMLTHRNTEVGEGVLGTRLARVLCAPLIQVRPQGRARADVHRGPRQGLPREPSVRALPVLRAHGCGGGRALCHAGHAMPCWAVLYTALWEMRRALPLDGCICVRGRSEAALGLQAAAARARAAHSTCMRRTAALACPTCSGPPPRPARPLPCFHSSGGL